MRFTEEEIIEAATKHCNKTGNNCAECLLCLENCTYEFAKYIMKKRGENFTSSADISTTNDVPNEKPEKPPVDNINPSHYRDGNIEVIDFIEDKKLGFCLGNAVKYISRSGKKHSKGMTDTEKAIEDLNKAKWYIDRRIKELKNEE